MFKKGDKRPKNAGRKKGTPNKLTNDTRQMIADCVDWKEFARRHKAIEDDAKYCAIHLKLLEFLMPKMKSVEFSGDQNKPVIIELPQMDVNDLRKLITDAEQIETNDNNIKH